MVAELIGFSTAPGDMPAPWIGLYQFVTAEGTRVQLHDMDLVSVEYRPSSAPTLSTRFSSDSPARLVTLRFTGVRDVEWDEDREGRAMVESRTPAATAAGQVHSFDWDGDEFFDLRSFVCSVAFRATAVSVTVA